MDAKELRELIEIISRSNFSRFELERDDFKLKLVKGDAVSVTTPASSVPIDVEAAPAPPSVSASPEPAPTEPPEPTAADSGLVDFESPIVGTYYRAPTPGAAPFVESGDRVKKGQVVCIVEAMKLMNEIEAEIDAEIVDTVAVNGQPVEFGEVLFRMRPL